MTSVPSSRSTSTTAVPKRWSTHMPAPRPSSARRGLLAWPALTAASPAPVPPLAGFAVDKTYCGHGIGEFFHCSPNIPHYAGNKAKFTMKVGHCFTIEPMINMGSWKVSRLTLPFALPGSD